MELLEVQFPLIKFQKNGNYVQVPKNGLRFWNLVSSQPCLQKWHMRVFRLILFWYLSNIIKNDSSWVKFCWTTLYRFSDNDPVNPDHLRHPAPLTSFDEWLSAYGMRPPSERIRSDDGQLARLFSRVSMQQVGLPVFEGYIQWDPSPGEPRLGWLWLWIFHYLAQLLSQFCQFPISPGRTRQRVEQTKSKSTQPRFARRWVSRYLHVAKDNRHRTRLMITWWF